MRAGISFLVHCCLQSLAHYLGRLGAESLLRKKKTQNDREREGKSILKNHLKFGDMSRPMTRDFNLYCNVQEEVSDDFHLHLEPFCMDYKSLSSVSLYCRHLAFIK
jgi:hypothetical protein